jgi:hypothetical protein
MNPLSIMQASDKQLDEHELFDHLKRKTEIAYRQSDVFIKNPSWSYSICGTPIQKGAGLLVGLNWGGGGNGESFPSQTYPNNIDAKTYVFIKRLFPYLNKYLKLADPHEINYSNLSFFRSPKVNDLKQINSTSSKRNYVLKHNASKLSKDTILSSEFDVAILTPRIEGHKTLFMSQHWHGQAWTDSFSVLSTFLWQELNIDVQFRPLQVHWSPPFCSDRKPCF